MDLIKWKLPLSSDNCVNDFSSTRTQIAGFQYLFQDKTLYV